MLYILVIAFLFNSFFAYIGYSAYLMNFKKDVEYKTVFGIFEKVKVPVKPYMKVNVISFLGVCLLSALHLSILIPIIIALMLVVLVVSKVVRFIEKAIEK